MTNGVNEFTDVFFYRHVFVTFSWIPPGFELLQIYLFDFKNKFMTS